MLPYDIRFRVFDKNQEHNWTSFLVKGGVSPIHVAELTHLLLLSVDLQDSGQYLVLQLVSRSDPDGAAFERSEFAIINTDNPEDLPVENELLLTDKDGLKLNLRIHYQCVRSQCDHVLAPDSGTESTQMPAVPSVSRSTRLTCLSTRRAASSLSRRRAACRHPRMLPVRRSSQKNTSATASCLSCSPIHHLIDGIAPCFESMIHNGLR